MSKFKILLNFISIKDKNFIRMINFEKLYKYENRIKILCSNLRLDLKHLELIQLYLQIEYDKKHNFEEVKSSKCFIEIVNKKITTNIFTTSKGKASLDREQLLYMKNLLDSQAVYETDLDILKKIEAKLNDIL